MSAALYADLNQRSLNASHAPTSFTLGNPPSIMIRKLEDKREEVSWAISVEVWAADVLGQFLLLICRFFATDRKKYIKKKCKCLLLERQGLRVASQTLATYHSLVVAFNTYRIHSHSLGEWPESAPGSKMSKSPKLMGATQDLKRSEAPSASSPPRKILKIGTTTTVLATLPEDPLEAMLDEAEAAEREVGKSPVSAPGSKTPKSPKLMGATQDLKRSEAPSASSPPRKILKIGTATKQ